MFRRSILGAVALLLANAPAAFAQYADPYAVGQTKPVVTVDSAGNHNGVAGNGYHVTCDAGCVAGGGAFHNDADAVATSVINGQTAAWLYGWNGATWDRLRVDGSRYLDVDLQTPLPAGSNAIGHVIADSGSTTAATQATAANLNATVVGTGTFSVQCTSGCYAGTAGTHGQTTALATAKVLKASAGTLYTLDVQADSTLYAAAWYVLVFDATADPGNGAVTPAKCYTVPANQASFTAGWPTNGAAMTTGIAVVVSTTGCFTETQSAHAFIGGEFQ